MKTLIKPLLLAVLVILAAFMSVTAVRGIKAPAESGIIPSELAVDNADAEYYLKDLDGHIAVYSGANAKTPIETTDIETLTLSETDRELLRRGIPADSRQELLSLIEDFGS